MHLNKSGSGMSSKTACGRNILQTPMSTTWKEFMSIDIMSRCGMCEKSRYAALFSKNYTFSK